MRIFIASVAVVAALTGYPAFAEELTTKQATRIDIDEARKAFIFIIDDKPVALLDERGLHVREGVEYGASLTDSGQQGFDDRLKAMAKEAADD